MNRNSFLSARHSGQPLLSAYGQLVATELALKDHAPIWPRGAKHDISGLLDDLGDPGLTALGAQLRTELSSIPCTGITGTVTIVGSNKYPDLRYARHANDHAGGVTDVALQNLVTVIEDIIAQLRIKGVAI